MTPRQFAVVALTLALAPAGLPLPAALAQDFSPYFETTGKGALDLYNDAVLCSVFLESQAEAIPDGTERTRRDGGARHAHDFALFMLEGGNVVDVTGAHLGPDNLPIDLRNARLDWQVVLLSLEDEGEPTEAEVARCLLLYGPDPE